MMGKVATILLDQYAYRPLNQADLARFELAGSCGIRGRVRRKKLFIKLEWEVHYHRNPCMKLCYIALFRSCGL